MSSLFGNDGVIYETVEVFNLPGDVRYYRCRRALLEIKTPFKLRNRVAGGGFYPESKQGNNRINHIPPAYYNQAFVEHNNKRQIAWT